MNVDSFSCMPSKPINLHCHDLTESKENAGRKRAVRQLLKAFFLCLFFMLAEIIGGLLANSLAIAADAAHLMTDLISFAVSLVAIKLSMRPVSAKYNFGWHRAEVLGALISVLMIWLMTVVLVFIAILRIVKNDFEIQSKIMIITAALGVAINICMLFILGKDQFSNSEESSAFVLGKLENSMTIDDDPETSQPQQQPPQQQPPPQQPLYKQNVELSNVISLEKNLENNLNSKIKLPPGDEKRNSYILANQLEVNEKTGLINNLTKRSSTRNNSGERNVNFPVENTTNKATSRSINVRAAFIHVIGDLVQSAVVLFASTLIYFRPDWKIADPICTFIFSLLVLCTTYNILKDIFRVLMEGAPLDVSRDDIKKCLQEISGVRQLHDLKIWSLTGSKVALSVHLAIDDMSVGQFVMNEVIKQLKVEYNIYEVTVQLELYNQRMERCYECTQLS